MPTDETVVPILPDGAEPDANLLADDKGHAYPDGHTNITIVVEQGELHKAVDQSEKVLAETGQYFDSSGSIVAVCPDPATGSAIQRSITPNALTLLLSRHCKFIRKTNSGVSHIDPPQRHVTILHDCAEYDYLPKLNGISLQPFLRTDDSLVSVSGYDKDSQTYGYFDADKYQINESPTKGDAEAALKLLSSLLSEFEYEEPHDKAAALAAMLTATVRTSLPAAPMPFVRANVPGSGKGCQCEVIACFATPLPVEPQPFPTNETDCRKELLSVLMRSPRVVCFDNLTTDLTAYDSLCLALTSEKMSGRVLGVSKMATVSTRTLFTGNGNNVGPVDDTVRRTLQITLSPKSEHPANRRFKRPNLVADIRAERERYVSAALTIVVAYLQAGEPDTGCKPLNSFGDWSRLCRHPLVWLGLPDPATSTLTLMNDNPGRQQVGECIKQIYKQYRDKSFTVKRLAENADGDLKKFSKKSPPMMAKT